ncbi:MULTISPECIES: hypothetical protein [Bradyrhizobium]|uniref:hypothetical protein n=1 Tax=Bradyrhizobium TaxID=374 RepID=UPI00031D1396|nr:MULTISPECIES: hypothetical protein [Bradyrhizobium]
MRRIEAAVSIDKLTDLAGNTATSPCQSSVNDWIAKIGWTADITVTEALFGLGPYRTF